MKKPILIALLVSTPVAHAQVTQEWVARYNGSANASDYSNAIAVDLAGNVYVTGESETGGISRDYITIKYNSAGVAQWVSRYDGPDHYIDQAYSIDVDQAGNVHVTGGSRGIGTERDFCTIKYDSNGDSVWVRRYNGPDNEIDEAIAVVVDESGNVYVTGYSDGGVNLDYYTIMYNASGVEQWASRYDGPASTGTGSEDRPHALTVDDDGNVYITGESNTGFGFIDLYATIKYTPTGDTAWVARFQTPGPEGLSQADALVVDGSGNVYVTGRSDPSSGFGLNFDILTIKYSPSGDALWMRKYNGPGNSSDVGESIALDSEGNIIVTGLSVEASTADYATIKYTPSGQMLWVSTYNGPANGVDVAYSVATDPSDNIYITGYSAGSGTGNDYATVKYDPDGVEQWVQRYNGPGNSLDDASSLVVDGSGNVYVTGESTGGSSGLDYATIKYSQAVEIPCEDVTQFLARCGVGGTVRARIILDNLSHEGKAVVFSIDDEAHIASVISRGDIALAQIAVAGFDPGSHTVALTMPASCFDPIQVACQGDVDSPLAEIGDNQEDGAQTALQGIYPNPFNPSTTIHYIVGEPAHVTVNIYNSLGQLVRTLVDDPQGQGDKQVTWNGTDDRGQKVPSGVYLCTVRMNSFVETRKILLLK